MKAFTLWEHVLPGEVGRGSLEDLVLQLEHPVLAPQRDQLRLLLAREAPPAAVIDVGLRHPVPQAAVGDAELLGDLRHRLFAQPSQLDGPLTELGRMRSGHQDSFRDGT